MTKDCRDCINCALEMADMDFYCTHPTVVNVHVFGLYLSRARKPGGICGPDAILFEERK